VPGPRVKVRRSHLVDGTQKTLLLRRQLHISDHRRNSQCM
jgi:hypothetical protein